MSIEDYEFSGKKHMVGRPEECWTLDRGEYEPRQLLTGRKDAREMKSNSSRLLYLIGLRDAK